MPGFDKYKLEDAEKRRIDIMDIDVKDVLENLDIFYEEDNGELTALCPYHDEENESWSINADEESCKYGVFNCFSCHASGNIFTLIKDSLEFDNYSQIVEWLESNTKVKRSGTIHSGLRFLKKRDRVEEAVEIILPYQFVKFTPMQVEENDPDDYYLKYVKNRIKDPKLLFDHSIGYCDQGYYRGRIIIPIFDRDKNLLTFEARHILKESEWIGYKINGKYRKVLYPKNSRTKDIVYPMDKIDYSNPDVIIVEGLTDYYALVNNGYSNVVSVFGNKFSQQKAIILGEFQRIIICPDADNGGMELLKEARKFVDRRSFYWVQLPINKDPAECTKEELKISFGNLKR